VTIAAAPRRTLPRWSLAPALGLAGVLLSGIGFLVDPRQAYASWLAALAAAVSTALGALLLVAITSLAGGRWFDPLRGLALDLAATLPLCALLFLVLLPGFGLLYPWVHAAALPNAAWLNLPFFLARAAAYFVLWSTVSLLLRRWARTAEGAPPKPPAPRERALAAVALPALGLTLTFAAFDWLMSLTPGWVSTVFGVYWFAGGFLAALALITLLAVLRGRRAAGGTTLQPAQAYALGTLMLTFVVFWAYIAYSQYFIIWIADVPAEVAWYLPRVRGGWGLLALALILGQFGLPLLVLLLHAAKRDSRMLGLIAGWLLVMHYLDSYWLVLPAVHPDAPHPHWLDLSALAAVTGAAGGWVEWLRRR
jgi:hypothetical protein